MHRPADHPAILGDKNKSVLDECATAYRAALAIAENGHQIESITVQPHRQPVIEIAEPGPDAPISSVFSYRGHRCGRGFVTERSSGDYPGCQVKWIETEED